MQRSMLLATNDLEVLAVHEYDRRHQARYARRDAVEIEAEQRLACPHDGAVRDVRLETVAAEGDRVAADVEEDFRAIRRAQGHRMPGSGDRDHFGVAW